MKVIFLDIDGVLNSAQSSYFYNRVVGRVDGKEPWCPIACSNLSSILAQCETARIVVSSSWRSDMEAVKSYFHTFGLPWDRVIGKTPWLHGMDPDTGEDYQRGQEILAWLSTHAASPKGSPLLPKFQLDDFVIIDDDGDMGPLRNHYLYLTDSRNGLTWSIAEAICDRFLGRPTLLDVKEEIPVEWVKLKI